MNSAATATAAAALAMPATTQGQAEDPAAPEELIPANPGRALMYTMVSFQARASSLHEPLAVHWDRANLLLRRAQGFPNWVIREGIASWVPFVVADLGLSEAERAMLMAAWFPGCELNPSILTPAAFGLLQVVPCAMNATV